MAGIGEALCFCVYSLPADTSPPGYEKNLRFGLPGLYSCDLVARSLLERRVSATRMPVQGAALSRAFRVTCLGKQEPVDEDAFHGVLNTSCE